ncbi:hypothetical protein F183_A35660 [Bryobacterales bacterium F-183]|nr:hypothetical protein F183_A35660 [Bryobacterales bacterium F-183]
MADRLYLSVWLRQAEHDKQLFRFERLLRAFPFSKLAKSESILRILALNFGEPPIAENLIAGLPDPEAIAGLAKEFYGPDSAIQVDCYWDLWQYVDEDWTLAPTPVSIYCFAPGFEREDGEDFRIEFGLDTQFLPERNSASGVRMLQSNIRSMLSLVHDVENRLPLERRLLWSESGENFAELLQRKLMSLAEDIQ